MVQEAISTLAIQLLICCSLVIATTVNNDRFDTESAPGLSDGFDTQETRPDVPNGNSPLSVTDVLNQRVNSKAELCPTLNVLMFFRTGNLEFLRDCYYRARSGQKLPNQMQAPSLTSSSERAHRTPVMASYSGRLLKRILQNIGDGPAKIDFIGTKGDAEKRVSDKRAPLSINGALSSLVDMLRYETSRDSGGPKYAFHTDLLHMG